MFTSYPICISGHFCVIIITNLLHQRTHYNNACILCQYLSFDFKILFFLDFSSLFGLFFKISYKLYKIFFKKTFYTNSNYLCRIVTNYLFFFTTASTSKATSFGSLATSTQDLAGYGFTKYFS